MPHGHDHITDMYSVHVQVFSPQQLHLLLELSVAGSS